MRMLMPKTRRAIQVCLVIIFFCLSALFGAVYWIIWQVHPDYFIINQEVNAYPIEELQVFLMEDRLVLAPRPGKDLNELLEANAPLNSQVRALARSRREYLPQAERLQARLDTLTSKLETDRGTRVKQFEQQQFQPYWAKRDSLTQAQAELERTAALVSPEVRVSIEHAIGEVRIQAAQNEVALAEHQIAVSEKIITQYGQFASPQYLSQLQNVQDSIRSVRDTLNSVEQRFGVLRVAAEDSLQAWTARRQNRVDFWYFIYFSLGISTSNAFGDLIPNHTFVRMTVITQIFSSVIIISVFLGSLELPRDRARPRLSSEG
jgi:hypothetical protein